MDLQKHFNKANLPLVLSKEPIGNFGNFAFMDERRKKAAFSIFQMTIDKKGNRENFRIFPGDSQNEIQVLDIDKVKDQILLQVREPRRIFETEVYDRQKKKKVIEQHVTNPENRKYLMGMDERHLFISELPSKGAINKVQDAFRILKPAELKDRKKRKGNEIKRQGEWFFTAVTANEALGIKENIKFIEYKKPIEVTRGKPHIADELIKIKEVVFVQGKIHHDDHKTRELQGWHRVYRNTEKRDMKAVHGWID